MAMDANNVRRTPFLAAFSGMLGFCIEAYDFYIYGTASALVFNVIFFPSFDPLVGTLLAFGTFGVGAVMRPLGGIVCGHFGDRIGRKTMLVWTLVIMGLATVLIGLVPSYAQIGVAAPITLTVLRGVQGFAVGGEWAGGALVAVEHAPAKRSAYFGSLTQMGSPIALFLSTGTFALLSQLPKEDFMSWGWRIPFLASGLLIVVGLVIRLRLLETPMFVTAMAAGKKASFPVADVLRNNMRSLLIGGGLILCTTVAFYVEAVFVVSYATQVAAMPRQTVLNAVLIASVFELVMLPLFAMLGDRIGVKPVALLGAIWTGAFSFPFFWLVNTGTPFSIELAISLSMVGIAALYSVLPSYVASLFPTQVRYTGLSIAYGVSSGLIAGMTPLLASALFIWAASPWPVALYVAAIAIITVVAIFASPGAWRSAGASDSELSGDAVGVPVLQQGMARTAID